MKNSQQMRTLRTVAATIDRSKVADADLAAQIGEKRAKREALAAKLKPLRTEMAELSAEIAAIEGEAALRKMKRKLGLLPKAGDVVMKAEPATIRAKGKGRK